VAGASEWVSTGPVDLAAGFAMMIGIGKAHEQVPPVEHLCDGAGHQAAALEIARREAANSSLRALHGKFITDYLHSA
jgi:hypothetical protein